MRWARIENKWYMINNYSEYDVYRVWSKGEKTPGIAMSRSIGDMVASSLGVICKPGKYYFEKFILDIIEYTITKDTKAVVLASDGVWEFLDNDLIKNIVMQSYDKLDTSTPCKRIMKKSKNAWKNEGLLRDDITVILIMFR